jgi:glycosyltransferase involved in cell wall biosynthesis
MAAGVPVVATEVGGNPELITHGKTGFLVPSQNEDRLLDSITQLIAYPDLRARFSDVGRGFARASFHMDVVCRRYEQLYLTVLAEKGATA